MMLPSSGLVVSSDVGCSNPSVVLLEGMEQDLVIRALRVKLEVDPAQPTLIRNEPGIGYRLIEAA